MEEEKERLDLFECPFRKEMCVAEACMFWTAEGNTHGYCNFNSIESSISTIEATLACITALLIVLLIIVILPGF